MSQKPDDKKYNDDEKKDDSSHQGKKMSVMETVQHMLDIIYQVRYPELHAMRTFLNQILSDATLSLQTANAKEKEIIKKNVEIITRAIMECNRLLQTYVDRGTTSEPKEIPR